MKYSTERKYKKYVKGYGFLSFARNFGDKYGKRLMDGWKKKQLIKLLQQVNKKKKIKLSTRNLHSTRKKATNY